MKNAILVVAGFVLYYTCFNQFEPIMLFIDKAVHYRLASYIITYIIIGIPIFVATGIINNSSNFPKHLGLQSGFLRALVWALVFSLPMFIGFSMQAKLAENISVPDMIAKTIVAGFFEELYFRGFLFGQLYKKTRLGFLPAIIICSIIFASGHLYQSTDAGILFGVFITTFMGSLLFAWLYVEWNYNLWVPISLHFLMNLAWYIFSVSDNALGNMYSNIFRAITISLSIILTIVYKKRNGEKLSVNRSTLLMKEARLV